MVFVSAVLHLTGWAFKFTEPVVSQLPVLARSILGHEVHCKTLALVNATPAAELCQNKSATFGRQFVKMERAIVV